MTQVQLSELTGIDQSRISRLENGGEHVSLDVIFRVLFILGIKKHEIVDAIM